MRFAFSNKTHFFLAPIFFLASAIMGLNAQTPDAIKPVVITGDVVSVSDAKIVIKTKDASIEAVVTASTAFKRVAPDKPILKDATPSTLAEISIGDRVMASGVLAADGKSLPARSVYLMKKSDISQKNAKEAELWRTRGIAGKVTAVNPQTHQVTVEIRTLTGSSTTVLTPKADAKFKRYAPNSVRYDEALDGSLAEIKQGDMIRALGDKSADGASFSAEQIVTGAFQTIAGPVKSIDTVKNEVVITDLQTKKDITVELVNASVMKKFPAEMAERLAGGQMGGAGGMRPPGQGGVTAQPVAPIGQRPPTDGAPGQGRSGFGGQRAGGSGGIDEMLDRFPNITAADLKVGDMIAISSSKSSNMSRVSAIKLLAGVEPFLRMAQATAGPAAGRGGRGVDGGFTIPGLDGIGFP